MPRQSGLVPELTGKIIFEPEYGHRDFIRGLEGFSHLWLIWELSLAENGSFHPTVRPPRLGGNTRIGVFASRSPFRPNPIGLSSVKLISIEYSGDVPTLIVGGADLADGTPILDIKPYLPYTDCHPDAVGGYTDTIDSTPLHVVLPENIGEYFDFEKASALERLLALDPRPSYHDDPYRVYGMSFDGCEIKFTVSEKTLIVTEVFRKHSSDR
ncbi:MAG: tRNA (N6-threonylcarbamoyladenosine(37)-N6)-methyltransferase TrmO [Firmicutes bacterium]|nr:tRNA (N6-threonylcarbamoyladenosine(37)-N6)-methyltransferase TrmO [Bacillota bacterium]